MKEKLKPHPSIVSACGRKVNQALETCSSTRVESEYPSLEKDFDNACSNYAKAKQAIMKNHSKEGWRPIGCVA